MRGLWLARVLAGINRLANTLEGRSITIFMERKLRSEKIERFSRARNFDAMQSVRDKLYIWALTHAADLAQVYDAVDGFSAMEDLGDRERDLWESLASITLLCDSDLAVLKTALKSKLEIIDSKAIQSVKSEVVNISDYVKVPANMNVYLDKLMAAVSVQFGKLNNYQLTAEDWESIYKLAADKYSSWNWTFGRSPDFAVRHGIQYEGDLIEYIVQVRRGVIREISNRDKSPGGTAIGELESRLIGQRYDTVQFPI